MSYMPSGKLLADLRYSEGDPKLKGQPVLVAYRDTKNIITIAFGHNLQAHPDKDFPACVGVACTPEQAEIWLVADVLFAERAMRQRWPWMETLPPGVYEACVELTFNMGVGTLAGFIHFLAALRDHDFQRAAAELEDSLWYRQVGSERGPRIVTQVRRGE